MTSSVFSVVLPVVVAVVMFGLGLALTPADFARVLTMPRAVLVTLLCQVVLLPAVCFGLVVSVGLGPDLAIGMMVLAASPGGVMANVFSHLAGGDVALNITVTAVNTVLSMLTLPVVVTLSVAYFAGGGAAVGLQAAKLIQVALVVLAPVAVGMVVRRRFPVFADRMHRPVRSASVVAVFVAICTAILPQLDGFLLGLAGVGLLCLGFSVLSLALGYTVPRLARTDGSYRRSSSGIRCQRRSSVSAAKNRSISGHTRVPPDSPRHSRRTSVTSVKQSSIGTIQ